MTKPATDHAAAAKLIRQELKRHNLQATVKAKSYAGGSSITVCLADQAPWTVAAVKAFAGRFQYGHFDGMTDCYEYSNNQADLPQVKFIFVNNTISETLRQEIYTYLRTSWHGYEALPELYQDAQDLRGASSHYCVSSEVHQVAGGMKGTFWQKPRVRIPAAVAA